MCLKHASKLTFVNEMCELSIEILISFQPPKTSLCLSLRVYMTLVFMRCHLQWDSGIVQLSYLFTVRQ